MAAGVRKEGVLSVRIEAILDAIGEDWRQEHQMLSVRNTVGWEHFSHGSDIGVRGFGCSGEEAFEQVAVGLTAIVADISRIEESETVDVRCDAPDLELLLVS